MRWVKLGRIFDPRDHALPEGCVGFAQSPQALVFPDFVRVYVATRSREPDGRFVSHPIFVDFSKDLSSVLRVAERPVLAPGSLGSFDEHGIFPLNVLRHDGRILGYTTGWSRRVSVSVETGIGLAVSRDEGLSFERHGIGPVLSASLREPFLVADGYVRVVDGLFRMWYIFGTGWLSPESGGAPERVYKIAHAVSRDGIAWTKDEGRQIVPDRLGPDECQALPCVFDIGTRRHMVFCYREAFGFRDERGRGYRLGHAWSDDLDTWTRDDEALPLTGVQEEWDGEMQ